MSPEEILCSKLFVKCELSGDFRTSDGERIEDEITLAAYAKAEMAKCGWAGHVVYKKCTFYQVSEDGEWLETEPIEFDPTDPPSEARAIIKACLEALELGQ